MTTVQHDNGLMVRPYVDGGQQYMEVTVIKFWRDPQSRGWTWRTPDMDEMNGLMLQGMKLLCFTSDIDGSIVNTGVRYHAPYPFGQFEAERMVKTLKSINKSFEKGCPLDFADHVRALAQWAKATAILVQEQGSSGATRMGLASGIAEVRVRCDTMTATKKARLVATA